MGTSTCVNKRRIFICTDTDYPSLDAASNYVSNMAKSLALAELDVYLISLDRSCNNVDADAVEWNKAELFSYISIPHCIDNKFEILKSRLLCGKRIIYQLKRMKCSSEDAIITYLYKARTNRDVVTWAKKNEIKIYATVVEWFAGEIREQNNCFKQYAKCDGVIAISQNIRHYFDSLGLRTMILPPMVDIGNETYVANKTDAGKVKFLYTGRFVGKDDMQVMLKAVALLPEAVKSNLEFHITRYNDDALIKESGIDETTWQAIEEVIVTHGDVSYEKLQQLLREADYLPIARQNNRTTISNFPSKIPEAIALGIVPVITRVGDCPNDYLTDGVDSILFDECTPECCARAFERAINIAGSDRSKFESLRNEAYNTAVKRFAVNNFSQVLSDFVS